MPVAASGTDWNDTINNLPLYIAEASTNTDLADAEILPVINDVYAELCQMGAFPIMSVSVASGSIAALVFNIQTLAVWTSADLGNASDGKVLNLLSGDKCRLYYTPSS